MTAVSATMAMPVLIRTVKVHIEKGNRAAEKSEQHFIATGLFLKEAKERKPADITWPDFVRQHFDLGRSRADELIQIADGRTTVELVRSRVERNNHRNRMARSADLIGESSNLIPTHQTDDEDQAVESDSAQVIWERGILARATEAVAGAAFEDWSHIEVGDLVVSEVRKAVNAWADLAAYLESLQPRPDPEPVRLDTKTLNYIKSELDLADDRDTQRDIETQLIDAGWRTMAKELHPDVGGTADAMARLNKAREDLKGATLI
jgi:hypothetical protein